jgi:hypothetical protein
MKKKLPLVALICLLLFTSYTIEAANIIVPVTGTGNIKPIPKDSLEAIQKRVLEIQAMDISQLTTSQRKELRQELKGIYKELKNNDDGGGRRTYIYISVGGLIVIILLLIILLR